MAKLQDVLFGVATAMETAVPDLTTALNREAGPEDNDVEWPHGEIIIVSNNRIEPWNTDEEKRITDNSGNETGRLLGRKHDLELQLNIWVAVPSYDWDLQNLGGQLETGLYRYDDNHPKPDSLPDGSGGTLSDVAHFTIVDGGQLPVEDNAPPSRGYQVTVDLRYTEYREFTEEEYIDTLDTPTSSDLTGGDNDDTDIEYNAN